MGPCSCVKVRAGLVRTFAPANRPEVTPVSIVRASRWLRTVLRLRPAIVGLVWRSAILALSTAIAAGGCGGSGAAPVQQRPDAEQAYRDAVNTQCIDARLDRELVPDPGGSGSADLAAYLRATLKAAQRSQRRLEAIEPPPSLAAKHQRGRRLGREGIALVAAAARSADRGVAPEKVLRGLQPALNKRIKAGNRIARALRTPQCRQEPLDLGFMR
jgi:hypothetical protein